MNSDRRPVLGADRGRTGTTRQYRVYLLWAAAALGVSIAVCCAQFASADTSALPPVIDAPLQVSISTAPTVFNTNGARHLAYEVQVTNFSQSAWTLLRLQARDQHGAALLAVDGNGMAGLLWHAGSSMHPEQPPSPVLAAGESLVAFMWIDLDKLSVAPTQLQHTLWIQREGEDTRQVEAPQTPVLQNLREISAPLSGTDWLAVNGPSNTSQHRRGFFVINGTGHVSQRYAIDWVRIRPDATTFRGDEKDNRSYLCFGEEVRAVADGVVAESRDGIPENIPHQKPVVPITLDTVAGNHINLDLGGGVFAMYAHLQPGSLRVKVGDRVRRGQVLALLGNTGNSTEPHLHFQLMSRNSPLGSEGLPYTLPRFTVTKRLAGSFGKDLSITPLPEPEKHDGEMPAQMQLVNLD